MICPQCHAEYLGHIKRCGDCNTNLIEASNIDLPIAEINWHPLPIIEGKIYADIMSGMTHYGNYAFRGNVGTQFLPQNNK